MARPHDGRLYADDDFEQLPPALQRKVSHIILPYPFPPYHGSGDEDLLLVFLALGHRSLNRHNSVARRCSSRHS